MYYKKQSIDLKNSNTKPMKKRTSKPPQKRAQRTVVSFLDEMKSELATFFEINYEKSFSLADIHEHFDVLDKRLAVMVGGLLEDLLEENKIELTKNGHYKALPPPSNTLDIGRVEHVHKKYAFVVLDGQNDVWIERDDLNGAVDGDSVEVSVFSSQRSKRKREGRVEAVVTRGRTEYVGTLERWPTHGIVIPDSRRMYEDIWVSEASLGEARSSDKVLIKITQWPTRTKRMEGDIVEVLGQSGDNNTEMHAILSEFGLPNRFSDELEAEANAISDRITDHEIALRRDMRPITTFTIDPADAKDFDDALSVEQLDNGNYEIGVHIADVSHYIQPNTALEKEAYARATSVYLVDRTVPMLPEKLSNNLCSLRPHEDKLTFSAVFELNHNAQIIKEWFGRTVIHSDHRFSYEQAQEVLDAQPTTQTPIFFQELLLLNTLAHKLRAKRFEEGAVNFETVEVKFKLDEKGKPLGVYQKVRKDSHKLIEEFMLLANKRVAEFVYQKSKKPEENTMVYRVHESPDLEKLRNFAAFAGRLGYKLNVKNEKQVAQALNQLLADVAGKPEQNALEQLAVRTMAKARYSTQDLGHFGLAFKRYSHFTSPIRRYPDVMAHRLLQHYLDGKPSVATAWYEAACKHSSERERAATDAERASIKYKQVEFMSLMEPNRTWNAVITGVTDFGLFVEITETSCEGMIRIGDLNDDHYDFDKENYRIIGRRTQKIFTFGDALQVRVKETNIARRSMDLILVGVNSNGKVVVSKPERRSRKTSSSPKSSRRRRR
jgi:ribonuclease R